MSGIEDCLAAPSLNKGEGLRVVCIRETLRDLKESAKLLIEDQLQEFGDLQGSR
jgi:phage terminase large subunit